MKIATNKPIMNNMYLVDVMTVQQKKQFYVLLAVWAGVLIFYLLWWFDPSHISSDIGIVVNSLVLIWTALLPGYFFFFVSRMKKPNPNLEIPDLRVAMIVTKTPSEPLDVVKRTILAMLAQEYPHDTWVADENPTSEALSWYKSQNVKVSSRYGVAEYHRSYWPRRTKTKEGNLAYFYDHYGYERYDVVVQLDADHVPQDAYLNEMLKPFINPAVGYVSAPSICSANANTSWTARGRLYIEAFLHYAQQAGHTNGFAPLCFGSHYAVRTKALKDIGGLGPELAEDHSTTLIMNGYGWKGVHAVEAIAIGDGPATFVDAMIQEFQWSRSLMTLFFTLTPKYISRLSWKLKLQFLFSQVWYPLFGIVLLTSYLLPIFALVLDQSLMRVSYFEFLLHSLVNLTTTLILVLWIKRQGWIHPANAKLLSWETVIFQLVRWPWVLMGCIYGIIGFVSRKQFAFKVTPKGENVDVPLPFKVLSPYLLIIILGIVIGLFVTDSKNAPGYYYFLILNLILYTIALFTIIVKHIHEIYENKKQTTSQKVI